MANKIREAREAKGWNQRELAEATHICQAIISELERETRKPWLKVAEKLSQALNVPIRELFPDDDFKK